MIVQSLTTYIIPTLSIVGPIDIYFVLTGGILYTDHKYIKIHK